MRARLAIAALAIVGVAAACGAANPGVTATRSRTIDDTPILPPDTAPPDTAPPDTGTPDTGGPPDTGTPDSVLPPTVPPDSIPVQEGIIDFGSSKEPRAYDGYLVAVFKDIEQFWTQQYPEVYGAPFEQLKQGVYAAYPGRNEPIPGCGTQQTTYADVQGNAFYCSAGDFMVYDDADLIPNLVGELGESAVGVVLAHEFGHAITARAGEFGQPTILKEQQADCFSGAWAAHVARGESDVVSFSDRDVKAGLIAMIEVRDPVTLSGTLDSGSHGTGFDRVGAFQDGFNGGPERCKTFFTEDRKLIQIPFQADDPNAGNLPFDQILVGSTTANSLVDELDRYWTTLFANSTTKFTPPKVVTYPSDGPYPSCAGIDESSFKNNVLYCPSTNEVLLDEGYARNLAGDQLTGDMSVGYLVSDGFSEAVLTAIGSRLAGAQRALADDCLTGSWVKDMVPPLPADRSGTDSKFLELSAGDLDEAIITAILRGDKTTGTDVNGTPFQKIDAFRRGVLQGRDGCQT